MAIAILDYGSGNLHSVARAIAEVGGEPFVTGEPGEVAGADAMVIPGVGHFGACMRAIAHHGLDAVIRDFHTTGRPLFGVCVGMQVLFERSDEDAEPGLALLPGAVRALPSDVKVPHMGWNTVEWSGSHPYVEGIPVDQRYYFVHSYAPGIDPDITIGVTEHGRPFGAVVARDQVFATQFHPEKSGDAGLELYERFVKDVASR